MITRSKLLRAVLGATVVLGGLSCEQPPAKTEGPVSASAAALIDIDACAELQAMAADLGGSYRLVADVNCTGFDAGDGDGFMPIGDGGDPFTGSFDGNGHVIAGLTIDRPENAKVGLFGLTEGASIERVGLVDADVRGAHQVGALVGEDDESTIEHCFATGQVSGDYDTGGLVGLHGSGSTITDSYAAVSVNAQEDHGLLVGWIVGDVERSYASGVSDPGRVGVLAGGSCSACFFDCEVAGECSSPGGASTAAMSSLTTYASSGWDFDETWGFLGPAGYPCLAWQNGCGCVAGRDSDGDGTEDCSDDCVADAAKTAPGTCGCGQPEVDSDGDGPLDCDDPCPRDPNKVQPGACGCNEPDVDADNDGLLNCNDSDWPQAVRDCPELQAMLDDLDGNYRLVLDIDCSGFDVGDGRGFQPIGDDGDPFTGTFDGNGHVITGLTIDRPDAAKVGLFGLTEGALIERVGLVDADVKGAHQVGALVGYNDASTINQCFATGQVSGDYDTGGLVGLHGDGGTISDSYAAVAVDADDDFGLLVGWVVGDVDRSYSSGASDTARLGVLSGGEFDACFFDCQVAGSCSSPGGTSTSAMQSEATFTGAGWDFDATWSVFGQASYPCLRWQDNCGDQNCAATDSTCNAQDDDCDGTPDDDFASQATSCGTGACARTGSTACVSGSVHDSCSPGAPLSDANCNAIDDDCDGTADDNYASQATSCGTGVCARTGNSSCVAGSVQSNCTPGSPTGTDATCNGVNEDCDASTDEAFAGSSTMCTVGGCAAHGALVCVNAIEVDTCLTDPVCDSETACADGADNDDDGEVDCTDTDCATAANCITGGAEICGNSLDDDSDGLLDCADLDCNGLGPCVVVPPDPATEAPALPTTETTTLAGSLAFLYSGGDPIQRGVVPGTFTEQRIAVIRGRVLDVQAAPLSGVAISVPANSEFGLTHTREDGSFDFVVNGGNQITLSFDHASYLAVQRSVTVDWHAPVQIDPVVLTAASPIATAVDFTGTAGPQLARGEVETDSDGTRQGTLLFRSGTRAEVTLANGTVVPMSQVDALNIRVTEYTVGALGGAAMPAVLPPNSAFTYAFDLAADGAAGVRFSQGVPYYLENFVGLPVGTEVPLGFYDPDRSVWVAADNGVVIKILDITGGIAALDTNGDAAADSGAELTAWGITTEEQQVLASTYQAGTELWRVVVDHFSYWDANMGLAPPEDANGPDASSEKSGPPSGPAPECGASGSIVECQSQALGERIALPGTSSSLNYRSDRSPGAARSVTVQLGTPQRLAAEPYYMVSVEFQPEHGAAARYRWPKGNVPQEFTWTWDGADAYGRSVQGRTDVDVTISYHYRCAYARTSRFGYNGNGLVEVDPSPRRRVGETELAQAIGSGGPGIQETLPQTACTITLKQKLKENVDRVDLRKLGLGGWSLSDHHIYDRDQNVLLMGNGKKTAAQELPAVIQTVYRKKTAVASGEVVALTSNLHVAPDGTLYMLGGPRIGNSASARTDSIVRETGAGFQLYLGESVDTFTDCWDESLEGHTVAEVMLPNSSSLRPSITGFTIAPNGELYAVTCRKGLIRIDRNEVIHRVAGTGEYGPSGSWPYGGAIPSGVPANTIKLQDASDLSVASDGKVYVVMRRDEQAFTVAYRILMIDTDGRANVIAGGVDRPLSSCSLPAGIPVVAKDVRFCSGISAVTTDTDGNLFIAEFSPSRVFRIDRMGQLHVVAGSTEAVVGAPIVENVDATQVYLSGIQALAIDNNDRLNIWDGFARLLLVDRAGGRLYRHAGLVTGSSFVPLPSELAPEGAPARDGVSGLPSGTRSFAVSPSGARYIGATAGLNTDRIVRIRPPEAGGANGEVVVASPDGHEHFVFDEAGRHLRTISAETGAVLKTFAYDASGRLTAVTDAYGRVTLIERNTSGKLTAIVAPHGQRTDLSENANGYLEMIRPEPGTPGYVLQYSEDGLLQQLVDPREGVHTFQYQDGRLISDGSPDSRVLTLQGSQVGLVRTVSQTETDAGTTSYVTDRSTPGAVRTEVEFADGTKNVNMTTANGGSVTTSADGTVTTTTAVPDPTVGMLAPLQSTITRLPAPGNLTRTETVQATTTRAVPSDPYSWTSRTVASTTISLSGSKTWRETYDRAQRRRSIVSPVGRVTTTQYDAFGQPIMIAKPGREPIAFTYDAEGRLISSAQGIAPLARTTSQAYAPGTGYLESTTHVELAQTSTFTLDAVGRTLSTVQPNGSVISQTYDALGNMTSLTPPSRPAHTLGYSPADLLQAYTAPATGGTTAVEQRDYTGHRKLRTLTRADGGVSSNFYRADGKLDHRTTSRGTTTYGYSQTTGQLLTMTETDGRRITLAYNGRLPISEAWSGGTGAVAGSISREYNDEFKLTTMRINGTNGPVIASYTYDADGLLLTAGNLTVQRDLASGDIDGTTLGSITTQHEINGFGEQDGFVALQGSNQLFSEQVTQRDAKGRIVERVEIVQGIATSYHYSYDSVGRLTDVQRNGVLSAHYDYDPNGNRLAATRGSLTETGTYDARDRLVTYGGRTYGFDAAGDLQSVTTATGATSYDYDELGNLRAVTLPDTRVIQYEIDSLNRRTGKRINGVRQYGLLYKDQLAPAALLNASNTVAATFVYGTSDIVPDFMVRSGVTYRFITDHLGSVRLVVHTGTGAVAQRIDYDEFGNVTSNLITVPGFFQPFGFAGGHYDADTGLVRFGARDYDGVTGRWTSKDPSLFDGHQENLYEYVRSDAINHVDVTGLEETLNQCMSKCLTQQKQDVAECTPDDENLKWLVGGAATVCGLISGCRGAEATFGISFAATLWASCRVQCDHHVDYTWGSGI